MGDNQKKKEIIIENPLKESTAIEKTFEKKLEMLSNELEQEKDHEKQQNILKTINSLLETIENLKGKQ